MNSPNPVSTPVTPLPSQWDSAIIRNIAYAGLTLLATVIADLFGLSAENVLAKGGRIIDAAVAFGVVAYPLYLAYKARKYRATPPITPQAVMATEKREAAIARAPEAAKDEAAK